MIYLRLFWEFLKIGLFSFGGGYGAVPIIREAVQRNQWMSTDMFSNMLAISESTPGPIMVNAATYIGNIQAGPLGAALATIGVVLPAFAIVIAIVTILKKWMTSKAVNRIMMGVKPCIMGIILAVGIYMAYELVWPAAELHKNTAPVFLILTALIIFVPKLFKKNLSPILLIIISAVLGIIFC